MPKFSDHHAQTLVKALYIGNSGAGKTGSLTSLVQAGYKLHIIDLDNGLDVLYQLVKRFCPDKVSNVDYVTERDEIEIVTTAGQVNPQAIGLSATRTKGAPKAYSEVLKHLTKWFDGTIPSEWGPEHILVLDSLSGLGVAALAWATHLNPTAKDGRTWFYTAQHSIESVIGKLTSEKFNTNVLVISHVRLTELPDGTMKGFANSVGQASGPILPRYFNNLFLAETSGAGKNVRRKILTVPTALIDLKNSAPFVVDQEFPLETGLATLFDQLKKGATA